ncbi:uncharacterized protein LOC120698931 [Panicum virgatum]|uniref:BED-type domain-containing protein n=1 Tax=Panicum virgatum TaxID=38727 RepID=A0A8T0UYW6_PANVG|nr:uncharacterized protein LOC120698931 [Panicum virgatum]KAG2628040.1 hypothetical protein PVAP13_3KG230200 [Panicum virgatum]
MDPRRRLQCSGAPAPSRNRAPELDPTSNNYELRLLGQAGDDEDDMDAEWEELFGSSVGPQDGSGIGDAAGTGHDTAAQPEPLIDVELKPCPTQSMAGKKRRRKSTSPFWEHFEETFEMRRGKEVRVGAKCKHCKKLYSGLSSDGTGHLTRHIPKCPVLKGRRSSGAQSLLQFNSDGSVAN